MSAVVNDQRPRPHGQSAQEGGQSKTLYVRYHGPSSQFGQSATGQIRLHCQTHPHCSRLRIVPWKDLVNGPGASEVSGSREDGYCAAAAGSNLQYPTILSSNR